MQLVLHYKMEYYLLIVLISFNSFKWMVKWVVMEQKYRTTRKLSWLVWGSGDWLFEIGMMLLKDATERDSILEDKESRWNKSGKWGYWALASSKVFSIGVHSESNGWRFSFSWSFSLGEFSLLKMSCPWPDLHSCKQGRTYINTATRRKWWPTVFSVAMKVDCGRGGRGNMNCQEKSQQQTRRTRMPARKMRREEKRGGCRNEMYVDSPS